MSKDYEKSVKDAAYYQRHRATLCANKRARYIPAEAARTCKIQTAKWKDRVFKRLGDKCVKCGFSDRRALQLDHINGGGTSVRKSGLSRKYSVYYRMLALAPDTEQFIQILCANCNWIKRHENKEIN
jgi:Zn ribbon nucleic-acid-binding protein